MCRVMTPICPDVDLSGELLHALQLSSSEENEESFVPTLK
jgi:hypothetical protein